MANSYVRRELDTGEVKFIVAPAPGGTVAVPAGAAVLFIFLVYKVFPWMPAVLVLGAGGFLFYRFRKYLNEPNESTSTVLVASPTGLVVRGQTTPRADIGEVTWLDRSPSTPQDIRHSDSFGTVTLWTVGGQPIVLAIQLQAGAAAGLAQNLGEALGGVPVSGHDDPFRRYGG